MTGPIPPSLAGVALAALGFWQKLALGPSWQEMLVQVLLWAILLAALWAFAAAGRSAAVMVWIVAALAYDAALLVRPPLPSFLVMLFTVLGFSGAVLYATVFEESIRDLGGALPGLLDRPDLRRQRAAVLALVPLWAAAVVLARTSSGLPAPVFPRSVHPAPPDSIEVKGRSLSLAALENPYRRLETQDPEKFKKAVAEGKTVYYQNCFFCHGDHLDGRGPAAEALTPRPANFQDPGTIAMLQESFVFWRVAKGGPGMPASGHPWNSAMPQWEKMLTEDEMWKAILWLYDYTGQSPRTWKEEKAEHP